MALEVSLQHGLIRRIAPAPLDVLDQTISDHVAHSGFSNWSGPRGSPTGEPSTAIDCIRTSAE